MEFKGGLETEHIADVTPAIEILKKKHKGLGEALSLIESGKIEDGIKKAYDILRKEYTSEEHLIDSLTLIVSTLTKKPVAEARDLVFNTLYPEIYDKYYYHHGELITNPRKLIYAFIGYVKRKQEELKKIGIDKPLEVLLDTMFIDFIQALISAYKEELTNLLPRIAKETK